MLYDADAKLRTFMLDLISGIFEIFKESLRGLDPFLVRRDASVYDPLSIFQDMMPILMCRHSASRAPLPATTLSPVSLLPRSVF